MAHRIEPTLPFDLTLTTFLVPYIAKPLQMEELIAIHARQLQKHEDNLAAILSNVLHSRFESVRQFEKTHVSTIHNHNFKPGALVLVRNSSIETNLGRKSKPQYYRPMVVICQTPNSSYRLAELDGTISKLRYTAFHLVPYLVRSQTTVPVT